MFPGEFQVCVLCFDGFFDEVHVLLVVSFVENCAVLYGASVDGVCHYVFPFLCGF